jgi:DHA1 family bicyclomycin/chloramphenicol resistance-like MFS transporter
MVLAVATSGTPPFWMFVVLLATVLFFQQMLIPNLNAQAMRPLGPVAGTAAAVLGMVPGVLGAVIGGLIDRQFDGTVTPISIGFVITSVVAFGAWKWASNRDVTTVAVSASG